MVWLSTTTCRPNLPRKRLGPPLLRNMRFSRRWLSFIAKHAKLERIRRDFMPTQGHIHTKFDAHSKGTSLPIRKGYSVCDLCLSEVCVGLRQFTVQLSSAIALVESPLSIYEVHPKVVIRGKEFFIPGHYPKDASSRLQYKRVGSRADKRCWQHVQEQFA